MQYQNWHKTIGNSDTGFHHHAFLIEGEISATRTALKEFLETEFGIRSGSDPDYFEQEYETFGIDHGRELKEKQSRKSLNEGGKKVFVLQSRVFTHEAQNSLLKIFEEPAPDTYFFILSVSAQFFLPTLRSRIVCVGNEYVSEKFTAATDFISQNYAGRLKLAQELAKEPERAEKLLEEMILLYSKRNSPEKRTKEDVRVLETALKYREYAHGRSPSLKMMLEHLALIVSL